MSSADRWFISMWGFSLMAMVANSGAGFFFGIAGAVLSAAAVVSDRRR